MKEQNNKGICPWCMGDKLYQKYHDQEWGVPCVDDKKLFEFLILESAQAGLNWLTILKKRSGYGQAFANFSAHKVALFTPKEQQQLLNNESIIRNKRKIESAVGNAQTFLQVEKEEGSFARYLWSFVDFQPIQNHWQKMEEVPSKTPLSIDLAKDMKKRGFRFFGPTIAYAYMQAMGLVNDHLLSCPRHKLCLKAGAKIQTQLNILKFTP